MAGRANFAGYGKFIPLILVANQSAIPLAGTPTISAGIRRDIRLKAGP